MDTAKKFAEQEGWTEEMVVATKMAYIPKVKHFIDEDSRFSVAKLLSLSGLIYKMTYFASYHAEKTRAEDNDSDMTVSLIANEWKAGRMMFPFVLQSWYTGKTDEFGRKLTNGVKGFLLYTPCLQKRVVVDANGTEHKVFGALKRVEAIARCFEEVFQPLGVATLIRNGKHKTSACTIDSVLGLYILADVVADLIKEYCCEEAIPEWHGGLLIDLNILLGKGIVKEEFPEDPSIDANELTEEQIAPSQEQDPVAILSTGSDLARSLIRLCFRRVFTRAKNSGGRAALEATITIAGKSVKYARIARNKVYHMVDQVKAIVEAAAKAVSTVVEEVYDPEKAFDPDADWLELTFIRSGMGYMIPGHPDYVIT